MNAISLKTIAMQTHRDLESAVLKGRFAGGRCYGYRTVRAFDAAGNPVKGEREIEPGEAGIVVRIFQEYAEGQVRQGDRRRPQQRRHFGPSRRHLADRKSTRLNS